MDPIDRMIREAALLRAERIENALYERDVVVVPYFDQEIVYRVPRWRDAPIRRLKIALYRLRRRLALS